MPSFNLLFKAKKNKRRKKRKKRKLKIILVCIQTNRRKKIQQTFIELFMRKSAKIYIHTYTKKKHRDKHT